MNHDPNLDFVPLLPASLRAELENLKQALDSGNGDVLRDALSRAVVVASEGGEFSADPDAKRAASLQLQNLAQVAAAAGLVNDAEKVLREALRQLSEVEDLHGVELCEVLVLLGHVHLEQRQAKAALEVLTRALAVAEAAQMQEHPVLGAALTLFGLALVRNGEFTRAIEIAQSGKQRFSNHPNLMTQFLWVLADSYHGLQQPAREIEVLNELIKAAQRGPELEVTGHAKRRLRMLGVTKS